MVSSVLVRTSRLSKMGVGATASEEVGELKRMASRGRSGRGGGATSCGCWWLEMQMVVKYLIKHVLG